MISGNTYAKIFFQINYLYFLFFGRFQKSVFFFIFLPRISQLSSRKHFRIKVTPDLHLTYSKNGKNLGLILKMKNIVCISILLTKHVKYTYLYLFNFVLYSSVAFKGN